MLSKQMAKQMRFVYVDDIYEYGQQYFIWMIIHPVDYRGVEVIMRPHIDPNSDDELAVDARETLAWEFERKRWFYDICLN